jgi:hypothetical protein
VAVDPLGMEPGSECGSFGLISCGWNWFTDSSSCLEGTTVCGSSYRLLQGYQCGQGGLLGGFFGSFIGPEGTIGGAVAGCVGNVTVLPPGPTLP